MKIYTARHGQTEWNLEGRMQGHIDIHLNDTGLSQAGKLAERFRNIPIGKIYSSDLSRALETAKIINEFHGVEIVIEPALRELNYGEYEGRLLSEVGELFNERQRQGMGMPGGEELEIFFKRVHNFLDKVTSSHDEDILIIGHGGTIRAVLCYFLGFSTKHFSSFGIGNTSVHCFERGENEQSYRVIIDNDTSHLEG